jgi:EPS-associated MarR family transcriptional regulator
MLTDEHRYQILKLLESRPDLNQRAVAAELGISLGKVNFCLRALIDKGLLKANNFRNNQNKRAYAYFLTPKGLEEKARITVQFLRLKVAEYEALDQEIERLRAEVAGIGSTPLETSPGSSAKTPASNLLDTVRG